MMNDKKIKSALISVYHKEGLEPVVRRLAELDVRIYSTGGTYDFIIGLGVNAEAVETLTSYPSILGGRVKTLHPRIFGGILGRRGNQSDIEQMSQYQIPEIDLVIVDLYPFSETVRSQATQQQIIEKIDIGGISLIRAAAKNFNDVLVVAGSHMYTNLLDILESSNGFCSIDKRKLFATDAFRVTSGYDTDIFNYFNKPSELNALRISADYNLPLRYGENPHQKATFYGDLSELFVKLHGREISYNNLLDIDAALNFIRLFEDPTVAIIKHNNACGLASGSDITVAWARALAGDPLSAFGGIIATNRQIDMETASEINKIFFEVLIAPGFAPEALTLFSKKKNRIILELRKYPDTDTSCRSALNGFLWQETDRYQVSGSEQKCVTERVPSEDEMADLDFANRIVMNTKSNAIVLVRERQLIGSGTGQTSRVDAVKQAIEKARIFGFETSGAVMASDAFFPFPDSITLAAAAGIRAVVQPGGSVKDQESVDECNRSGLAMIFTGIRHFRH
ncbi:MAG: bifunctional phosphoribosylaminoimidazolecarboxamide formyltransferase/IMP cyclohydrolase [Bacteroidales bacterium]